MSNYFWKKSAGFIFACLIFVPLLMPMQAQARAIDDVKIKVIPEGYQITMDFLFSIQYQTYTANNLNKEFYAQLKTIDFRTLNEADADSLRERVTFGPDPTTAIPLQEITFEGYDPERPQITFVFTEPVELALRSSGDLRHLIVTVKVAHPAVSAGQPEKKIEAAAEQKVKEISLPQKIISKDELMSRLLEEARVSLQGGQYSKAVQIYTKILRTAQGPVKQQAQELLGVARERNGQLAHAKAEYEKYLQEFPTGVDAERVRQRLAGLITSVKAPKEKLKGAKAPLVEKKKWMAQNFGSFSQFFFRDQTVPVGGSLRVNRSDMTSSLDWNSRLKRDTLEVNARFTGSRQQNFIKGGLSRDSILALSVDMRDRQKGYYAKLGRQSLSTGGVLGRFDGMYLSSRINPIVKINAVAGYPVESVHQTSVKTDKRFYGVNFDFGTFKQRWDFNTFFINQDTFGGRTDRRAIGGEARYMDPTKAAFVLLDYDIYFNLLNMLLFNGHWTLPTKTTFNLVFDYRKSPLLSLTNSIQGQGVTKLSDLTGTYTDSQLKQLAVDRTTNSKFLTFGITQDLKENLQLLTEATVSEIEGTVSSGGVEGEESLGKEYTYSTQLIANNVFMKDDVVVSGLSFTNGAQNNTFSLNFNGRFPVKDKLRIIPKFRTDFRNAKSGGDNQISIRPTILAEYNATKWMRFEVEAGIEQVNAKASGVKQNSTESFISAGFRINF